MDALTEVLDMCPIAINHVHISTDRHGYVVMSCEIADIDQGLTEEQSRKIEDMLKQLVNMACTVMCTDPFYKRLSIEMAYSSYDEWLDAVGTIISVERVPEGNMLKIERYDPNIMDTVISYRNCYELEIMQQLQSITINT